jgi:hypothetical protein
MNFDVLAPEQPESSGRKNRRSRRGRPSPSRSSDASEGAAHASHSRTASNTSPELNSPASELALASSDDDRALLWRHWAAYVRSFAF